MPVIETQVLNQAQTNLSVDRYDDEEEMDEDQSALLAQMAAARAEREAATKRSIPTPKVRPRPSAGDRVGAVMNIDAETGEAVLLGYGVYVGEEVPPAGIGLNIGVDFHALEKTNPKIQLDNGDVVWGCECWWGPEEVMSSKIQGLTIREARISEFRTEAV